MLALRTLLVVAGTDDRAITEARDTSADTVVFDLAAPTAAAERPGARAAVSRGVTSVGAERPVVVRVSAASTGELEADLEAAVRPTLAAVVVAGTEVPQDARDADVLLRKFELKHGMMPGHVRLVSEIDSAAGLQALPAILEAVDRHEAVALNPLRMHRDLGLGRGTNSLLDYTMATVAVAARAAELPWILAPFRADRGFIEATRAQEFGAAGTTIQSEAAARGVNSLFAPDGARVAAARAILEEWEQLQTASASSGLVTVGHEPDLEVELVDRRAMRAARLVVAQADAVAARERTNG